MDIDIVNSSKQYENELKNLKEKKGEKIIRIIETTLKNNINKKIYGEIRKKKKIEHIRKFKVKDFEIGLFEIRIGKHSMNIRIFACGIIKENDEWRKSLKLTLLKVIYKKKQKLSTNDIDTSIKRCKHELEEVFYEQ